MASNAREFHEEENSLAVYTLNGSKSAAASRERDLGFIADSLLKTLSKGSGEVKKPNRNVRNEYRRNKEHDYASVYFMVC